MASYLIPSEGPAVDFVQPCPTTAFKDGFHGVTSDAVFHGDVFACPPIRVQAIGLQDLFDSKNGPCDIAADGHRLEYMNSVQGVLAAGNPFEVFNSVITRIAIFVIYAILVWSPWLQKMERYQSMNTTDDIALSVV